MGLVANSIIELKDTSRIRSIALADERNQSLCLFDLHDLTRVHMTHDVSNNGHGRHGYCSIVCSSLSIVLASFTLSSTL